MKCIWLNMTDSTNALAARCRKEAEHLTVWSAEYQSEGKGQRGNKWESADKENLTFSILVKPTQLRANNQFVISQIASLAVVEYLRTKGVEAKIKWPNDIYVGDKKICGMLIENFLSGDKLSESIIGIGLNINQKLFSKDIPNPTSLILETSSEEKYDVKKELEIFVEIFSQQYAQIISADPEQLKANARYCQLLYRIGEEHRYIQTDYYTEGTPGEIVGKIVGIEEKTARLILQLDNGQLRKYFFKEIAYII